jgi:hypothetical protein
MPFLKRIFFSRSNYFAAQISVFFINFIYEYFTFYILFDIMAF